jgi:hypothetical protein
MLQSRFTVFGETPIDFAASSTPSVCIDTRRNKVHCFAGGFDYSTIDLVINVKLTPTTMTKVTFITVSQTDHPVSPLDTPQNPPLLDLPVPRQNVVHPQNE